MKTIPFLSLLLFLAFGCDMDKSYEGFEIRDYKESVGQKYTSNPGQAFFAMDSLGSFSLTSLFAVNILPIKIYGTALLLMDQKSESEGLDGKRLPTVMKKFGFIQPAKIANWDSESSPEPEIEGSLGFIHTQIEQQFLGKKFSVEVANITCAACHSSVTFDQNGIPKNEAWLGAGNSSLNLDGFLQEIYYGLVKGMKDPRHFLTQIREAYPDMSRDEELTIHYAIFPKIQKALKQYKKMGRVLPFPNGGPGHTNGVGAFKRAAKILKQPFTFHSEEAGVVGIPNLMDKGFRSSYTIDGAYGVAGKPRYKSMTKEEARDPQHLNEMSHLAAFFSYSAMGNSLNNVEPNIPKVEKIFATFVRDLKPHKFPGQIDRLKASRGEQIYKQSCSGCHGIYSEGLDEIELQSFPNKQVAQALMGSDPYRWKGIDQSVVDFSNQNVFAKYIDAGKELGGYTAPILTGIWFKAPYLHNGSVPTLWQLLNPELRPKKFLMGGHAIDMVDVGIKGELNTLGEYVYPSSYTPWSQPAMFDTSESGKSNLGHEKMFEKLNSNEKRSVIEYLKLL